MCFCAQLTGELNAVAQKLGQIQTEKLILKPMKYIFRFGWVFLTSLLPFYSRQHLNLFLYFKQILESVLEICSLGEFRVFFFACELMLSLRVHVVGHLSKREKKVCIFVLTVSPMSDSLAPCEKAVPRKPSALLPSPDSEAVVIYLK